MFDVSNHSCWPTDPRRDFIPPQTKKPLPYFGKRLKRRPYFGPHLIFPMRVGVGTGPFRYIKSWAGCRGFKGPNPSATLDEIQGCLNQKNFRKLMIRIGLFPVNTILKSSWANVMTRGKVETASPLRCSHKHAVRIPSIFLWSG